MRLSSQRNNSKSLTEKKLNIDVQNQTIGSISEYGLFTASNIRTWQPYLGFTKISEEQFFRTAGYTQEANQAKQYRKSALTWSIVGGGIILGGLALMMYAASMPYYSDWETPLYLGGGIATIGSIPLSIGVIRFIYHFAPLDLAIDVMNDYNTQLKLKIVQ